MKKKNILAAALALTLLVCAGVGSAHAYFTTYAEAQGGHELELEYRTEIQEEFYDWTKHVTIKSDENSVPVYVRVKVTAPGAYAPQISGENWTENEDGWWYYGPILEAGEITPELLVLITGVPEDVALQDGDNFNVIVSYEATRVLYDENNQPYADWNRSFQLNGTEGGGE